MRHKHNIRIDHSNAMQNPIAESLGIMYSIFYNSNSIRRWILIKLSHTRAKFVCDEET